MSQLKTKTVWSLHFTPGWSLTRSNGTFELKGTISILSYKTCLVFHDLNASIVNGSEINRALLFNRLFLFIIFPAASWNFVGLLQLLLGSDVRGMATLLLATVSSSRMKPGVALAANHFVRIVFLSQKPQGRFNDTTTKTQHQVKSWLYNIKWYCIKNATSNLEKTFLPFWIL